MHLLAGHLAAIGQGARERQVGGDAVDVKVGQRPLRAAQRGIEAPARVHDQLGQQRVVVRRGRGPGKAMRIHADAGAGGHVEAIQRAAAGRGLALRIQRLGVDAPLDGTALRARRRGGIEADVTQPAPGRQLNLRLHQIDAEHGLGDGVLDLQARVGLHEDEGQLAGRRIDQKFEGAQVLIAHGARHPQRRGDQALAQRFGQHRAGRDFDQLLKAPLQRAVALAQGDHVVAIAEQLNFDVARALHQALDIHAVHAKGRARLTPAALIRRSQFIGVAHRTHATPATAADGLDHHARAALRGQKRLRLIQRDSARAARQQRHAAPLRQRARLRLVAQQRQLLGRGADEDQAGCSAIARKVGALAQKTVAGVNGIGTLLARDGDQVRGVEVRRRASGAQGDRAVGRLHVGRLRIVVGVHRHAGDAQLLQSAHDAQGDFAAIGDQDFFKHMGSRGSSPAR